MSDLSIDLHWSRKEAALEPNKYDNTHTLSFNESYEIPGDAAPDWGGNPANTNPEQALAASLSSCHLMTFLALCAKAGWPVASYHDHAVAHLGKNPKGRMSVTQIDLHPRVTFDTGFEVDPAEVEKMQHRAHRYCFVAASLADFVEVNIKAPVAEEV